MKFSIRDVLLVTVIVALAMGWGVDRAELNARIERLEQAEHSRQLPIIDSYISLPTSQAPAKIQPKD